MEANLLAFAIAGAVLFVIFNKLLPLRVAASQHDEYVEHHARPISI